MLRKEDFFILGGKVMKISKIFKMLILTLAILLMSGCSGKLSIGNDSSYPMTIKDNSGMSVVIDKEPEKVVSLSPVTTEIIAAIGGLDKLVGRTSYCDYPKEVKEVDEIGDLITVNVEKIVELDPDLVIGSAYLDQGVRDQLENAGMTVVTIYTEDSFEGTYKDIETIGKILGKTKGAAQVVAEMKDKVESIKEKVAKAKTTPSVYFVVGFGAGGEFTATGDTFIHQMIEMAGGKNIAYDGVQWSFSLEKIVERNPELVIYSSMLDKNELIRTNGFKDLDSVKKGSVLSIEANLIERTGPRLAEGLEELAKLIHPELY
ncbi:MAG: iron complex transport system substrate-binding protein [Fusobacteria bacterium]|nr:MAG: iron complex transport system substrate-binding protein [Fusobacteriota bacterium]KAF0230160.1 MAG: iron complex transport system substrate-binding [Fusobacteriota bacterium]